MLGLSPYSLERVDAVEHPHAAEGARITGGVGFSGIATHPHELSLGWNIADSDLGLFFRRGISRWLSAMMTFSEGLRNLRPCPQRERRRHLKNEFFRISNLTTLFGVICLRAV